LIRCNLWAGDCPNWVFKGKTPRQIAGSCRQECEYSAYFARLAWHNQIAGIGTDAD